MELQRTGRMMAFLDVSIGQPYFAHGRYWVRTDFEAGTALSGSQDFATTCNFVIEGKTRPSRKYSDTVTTCEEIEEVRCIVETQQSQGRA